MTWNSDSLVTTSWTLCLASVYLHSPRSSVSILIWFDLIWFDQDSHFFADNTRSQEYSERPLLEDEAWFLFAASRGSSPMYPRDTEACLARCQFESVNSAKRAVDFPAQLWQLGNVTKRRNKVLLKRRAAETPRDDAPRRSSTVTTVAFSGSSSITALILERCIWKQNDVVRVVTLAMQSMQSMAFMQFSPLAEVLILLLQTWIKHETQAEYG